MSLPPPSYSGASAGSFSSLDPYASLRKSTTADDETRPLAKGEFTLLISKLNPVQKAQLQKTVVVFKALAAELPKAKEELDDDDTVVKARTAMELQKAVRTILISLRKKQVDDKMTESIKLQLYQAYLLASNFEKAVAVYPRLKAFVGGRLKGIYALAQEKRETILKHELLTKYFLSVPNARDGLLAVLGDPSKLIDKPDPRLADRLYHFGSLLPLYYLLASCADLTGGLCGNCSGTTEDRIRMILGESFKDIKPGFLGRVCEFATIYS